MNHAVVFAQHFSRLAWVAGDEGTGARDEELEFTARAAEALLRGGAVSIASADWRLTVNDEPMPPALSGLPDLMLAARFVAHSVAEIGFDPFTHRSELVAAARALAAEPDVGDGGKKIAARFATLGLQKVRLAVTGTPFGVADTTAAAELEALRRRHLTPEKGGDAVRKTPAHSMKAANPEPHRGSRQGQQLAEIESDIFGILDSAARAGTLSPIIDDLVRQAETAAARDETDKVFEIMYALVAREAGIKQGSSRAAYMIAIKRISTRTLSRSLAKHLARHREYEDQILAIFNRLGEEGAEFLLEELADTEVRFERRAMFDILGQLNAGRAAMLHALDDTRWYVARNAAELLGQLRAQEAADDLIRAMGHADERVRRSAAISVGQLAGASGTDALIEVLNDPAPQVRAVAANALGMRRGARSLDALMDRLDKEDNPAVQSALLDALGRNGAPTAVTKLIEASGPDTRLFKRKSSAYRSAAAAALKIVDSEPARIALERLKQDKDPSVRSAAGG